MKTTLIVGLAAVAFVAGCGGGSNGWNSTEESEIRSKIASETSADQAETNCIMGVVKAHYTPQEILKAVQEGGSASIAIKLGGEVFAKCNLSHSLNTSTSTSTEPPSTPENPTSTPPNPSNEVKPPCSKEHPCEAGENGE